MRVATQVYMGGALILFASFSSLGSAQGLDDQVAVQKKVASQALHSAVSPIGGAAGSVMASPSRSQPNYFYHWVRDASITARALVMELSEELNSGNRSASHSTITQLQDFVRFSLQNQATPNPSGAAWDTGLGEPKFNLDGTAFTDNWGRPQNDGPALRAIAMMEFSGLLEKSGQSDYVRQNLYRTEMPARTLIKADLEYVGHHWRDPSFDLWEERMGDHFFTRIVQWKALDMGAAYALRMGDTGASSFYASQAQAVLASLKNFWNSGAGYVLATLNQRVSRLNTQAKPSNLDIAIVLGVIQAGRMTGDFSVTDSRIYETVTRLEAAFDTLYGVNARQSDASGLPLAPGIGRYPEDRYDGYRTDSLGNPWFLATQAMAEYYYRLARAVANGAQMPSSGALTNLRGKKIRFATGNRDFAQSMHDKGDAYLRRAFFHTDARGHQSEQFNRESGYMQGAIDLTWSYASFLTAIGQR